MIKQLKAVSMLLFLMDASTEAAYAVAYPGVTDVKSTQQSGTCTGDDKESTGETVNRNSNILTALSRINMSVIF